MIIATIRLLAIYSPYRIFDPVFYHIAEVAPFKIKVTVNCPPDTDTPGFALENTTKPEETHLICGGGGLFPPSQIARY